MIKKPCLMQDEQDAFERFCYELYKKDWIHNHLCHDTEIRVYGQYMMSMGEYAFKPFAYSFEEYLDENNGYDGELYACFEEFLGAEYLDASYMVSLLSCVGSEVVDTYYRFQMPVAA